MKIMYLTIVCPPMNDDTDGKVLLLRVSREDVTKRAVSHQKFVSDHLVNQGIKNGDWKLLFHDPSDLQVCELH